MKSFFVFANWKMNLCLGETEALVKKILNFPPLDENLEVGLFPSFPHLSTVSHALAQSGRKDIVLGAQDCSEKDSGSFTGDVSVMQILDFHCRYVLVGHSERRQYHQESLSLIRGKIIAVLKSGMIPVVCIPEGSDGFLPSWDALSDILSVISPTQTVFFAYEPTWAIGSGQTPEIYDLTRIFKALDDFLKNAGYFSSVLLYGGSIQPKNAEDLALIPGISGFLVGGSSLDSDSFQSIIKKVLCRSSSRVC